MGVEYITLLGHICEWSIYVVRVGVVWVDGVEIFLFFLEQKLAFKHQQIS